MARITIGGGAGGARSFSGVLAGLAVNGARPLDRAAAADPALALRGDVRRAHALDPDLNRMQQTPPSGYGGPGVLDELVYSGAGSGCRDDDEDACVLPDAGSGDDLITPVYVPSTRRPPKMHKGDTSGKLMKPCDDEDCIEGSGAGGEEIITEPEHPMTSSGISSTHSMTSPTAAISTEHERERTSPTEARATVDTRTTPLDHDNIHAATRDTATTPDRTTPTEVFTERTHTSPQFTPSIPKHTDSTHYTENNIPDYEDHHPEKETRTPTFEMEEERIPSRGHADYNGYEHEITTKWYHPKTTDNRVVPPESEFFATIVGIVASVLIAIILIVIIVLKLVFKLDTSYKVTEDKNYQQSASAALLGNQAHSSYQTGASSGPSNGNGGAVRGLQPLPLGRTAPAQPVKRDGIKEWYV